MPPNKARVLPLFMKPLLPHGQSDRPDPPDKYSRWRTKFRTKKVEESRAWGSLLRQLGFERVKPLGECGYLAVSFGDLVRGLFQLPVEALYRGEGDAVNV